MAQSRKKESNFVYSTEQGKMCAFCGQEKQMCICAKKTSVPKGDGIVRVGRETKGRKGKGVTIVKGLLLDNNSLKSLAKQLKQKCGSGGTVKDGIIEIQGDHRETVIRELEKQGLKAKLAGG